MCSVCDEQRLWLYLLCTSHAALSPTFNNKSFAYLRWHIHAIKLYNGKYVGDIFVPFFWGFVFLFCFLYVSLLQTRPKSDTKCFGTKPWMSQTTEPSTRTFGLFKSMHYRPNGQRHRVLQQHYCHFPQIFSRGKGLCPAIPDAFTVVDNPQASVP